VILILEYLAYGLISAVQELLGMGEVGWLNVARIGRGQNDQVEFSAVALDVGAQARVGQQSEGVHGRIKRAARWP
jgi:hypothetical protein